jgi:hypothetical protein
MLPVPSYAKGVRLRPDAITFYALVDTVGDNKTLFFIDRYGNLYLAGNEFNYATSSFPSARELIGVIRRKFGKRVSIELRGAAKALAVKKVPR